MENQKPTVSIILPVCNNDTMLAATLKSLLTQSYEVLEIIAIDDKSTDNSLKILKQFRKQDKRLHISQNVKRYGLAITLNRALRKVTGDMIVFAQPYHIYAKAKLKKQLSFLLTNPKTIGVGTQCSFVDGKGRQIGISTFPLTHTIISTKPVHGSSIYFESMMINKHKIPKDILRFTGRQTVLMYSAILMNLLQYGELANLPDFSTTVKKHIHNDLQSIPYHLLSLSKLWLKSAMVSDSLPSVKSFFFTSFRPTH